jgi:enoyl-CoA hydratase/carnithine racemase
VSESPSGPRITVRIADGIAAVEIDNPSQRNALTKPMCVELQQLVPRLDTDPDVVAITLRGSGTSFSTGVAIGELPSVLLDPQPDGSSVDHLSLADDAIASVSKPIIALVDGACMGGGWQIASACDFIVASERSVFAITPAKLGVVYPRSGIERLIRQTGDAKAKYILFTGETFSASRAQALGLAAEVVADGEFESRCAAIVATVLSNSQFSVHTLKSLISRTTSDAPHLDRAWSDAWTGMIDGPDMGIGVGAFQNRERPSFTWTASPHP